MSKKICSTHQVDDSPSEIDEFGAHEKLADVIASLIQSSNSGGKTIGLEGSWGSGKSTVIYFLEKKLNTDENLFVLFDAWAHHDDPLRRTFLEKLIIKAHSKGENWINNENWNMALDVLAQRTKYERKINYYNLQNWARVFIIASFLLPIGMSMFSAGISLKNEGTGLSIAGAIIALFPLGVLLFKLAHDKLFIKEKEKKYNLDPWSFVINHTDTDVRTETYQSINPTSLEFKTKFDDLMNEVLSNHKDRKVIIILDNLDRVGTEDALALLATLQIFMQHDSLSSEWLKRVWIIIPFDPEGLRKLWKNDIATANADDGSSDLALSFLDKRFQIRFEVPPVVLSDWSDYLKKLLSKALPSHNANEFHAVYRVFYMHRKNKERPPTPRELKIFVNQIGALHRLWQDTFPLPYLGFYVIEKRNNENIVEKLLKSEYKNLDHNLRSLLDTFSSNDVEGVLAALVFNTDIENARQLLLEEPVKNALESANSEKLKELSQIRGFEFVLENLDFSEWINDGYAAMTNIAKALSENNFLSTLPSVVRLNVILKIKKALLNTSKSWLNFTPDFSKGLAILLQITEMNVTDARKILARITRTDLTPYEFSLTEYQELANSLKDWSDAFISLASTLSNLYPDDFQKLVIIGPPSGMGYLEICAKLYEEDPIGKYWSLLKPADMMQTQANNQIQLKASEKVLSETLANLLSGNDNHWSNWAGGNKPHPKGSGAIEILVARKTPVDWSPCIGVIASKLKNFNSNFPGSVLAPYYDILWKLKDEIDDAKELLSVLAKDGYTLHHLFTSNTSKSDSYSKEILLLTQFYYAPNIQKVSGQGNTDSGRQLIRQIFQNGENIDNTYLLQIADKYQFYNFPFRVIEHNTNAKPWIIRLLKQVSEGVNDNWDQFFQGKLVAENWDLLCEALGEEVIQIIKKDTIQKRLIEFLVLQAFESNKASLYTNIIKASATENPSYKKWCVENVENLQYENLESAFINDTDLVDFLIEIAAQKANPTLDSKFQDALLAHAKGILSGNVPSRFSKRWSHLFEYMDPIARKTFQNSLLDIAEQREGDINGNFFTLYGQELALSESLLTDRQPVRMLLIPIIKNHNMKGLEWLEKSIENNPKLLDALKKQKDADHTSFKKRIKEELEKDVNEMDENSRKHISIIWDMLTNRKTRNTKESSDDGI